MRLGRCSARALTAMLALGLVAAGLASCGEKQPPEDSAPKPMDKGIKDFDFDNATVRDRDGKEHKFKDGHVPVEGYEDKPVGWTIDEGPAFADIDGDNDLDAALIYLWTPAAGSTVATAYIWTWDGDRAVQVEHPIAGNNYGAVRDLKAENDGFKVTTFSRPYGAPGAETEGEEETFTIGFRQGHPVQTQPAFGAVDRCVSSDGASKSRGDGTPPRVAPQDDAPGIGKPKEFETIHTVASMRSTDDWKLVRAERVDGTASCGWLKADEIEQN